MSALIGHAVYGKRVLDKYFPGQNEAEFFVGTTFPDIRNLGVISRDQTHLAGVRLADLQACESSFDLGFKLHSLIDDVHFRFMKENGIYNFSPDLRFAVQAFKVFEDRLLYPKLDCWVRISGYFDQIFDQEQTFGIDLYDVRRWHNFIKRYYLEGPSEDNTKNFNAETGFPSKRADDFLKTLKVIEGKQEIKDAALNFYDQFDQLISG